LAPGQLHFGEQYDFRNPAGQLQGYHDVGDQECVFQKDSANGPVLLAPTASLLQEGCALASKSIHQMAGTALVVVVELGAGTLQIAVVEEQLQAPQELLRLIREEYRKLRRTQKTVPLHMAKDFAVAFGDLDPGNGCSAFEAGKAEGHSRRVMEGRRNQ
jgi:hypothetical protein